jgi:hypothetical protein
MAFAAGVFSRLRSFVTDRDNGVRIRADLMDSEFDGMATGLSTCVLKDGTQTITANIPMASHKFTGLSAGTTAGDSLRYEQVVGGSLAATFSSVIPSANDSGALGSAALSWADLFLASGGVINWNTGDVTVTHSANLLAFAGATSGYTFDNKLVVGHTANLSIGGNADNLEVLGTDAATGAMAIGVFSATSTTQGRLDFYKSANAAIGSATAVVSGERLGILQWWGAQQTGTFSNQNRAATMRVEVDGTVTDGAGADMPGRFVFATTADGSGTPTDRLILDSAGVLKPNANDGVALGTTALSFSDLFLASGAVLNFNNGNYTVTHSAALLTTSGALTLGGALIGTSGTFSGVVQPSANDAAALGASGTGWSDLFLASGGVINWNAGNVTLTHSAGALTQTGDLAVAGTITSNTGYASSVTSNTTYVMGSYRNLSNGAAAQLQFNFGNDSSSSEFSILVNGSGIAGSSRQVTLTAQGGALTLQAGGLLNAPPVQSNTSGTAANVAVDALGQIRRSTSSLRYKKNVRDYDRGVADALKLRPVYYESKTEDLAGQIFAGLIAEEVHEAGLTEYVVYDEKGRPDALHYPHMAALFVAVTKELKAEIEDLKAELKELKTR